MFCILEIERKCYQLIQSRAEYILVLTEYWYSVNTKMYSALLWPEVAKVKFPTTLGKKYAKSQNSVEIVNRLNLDFLLLNHFGCSEFS